MFNSKEEKKVIISLDTEKALDKILEFLVKEEQKRTFQI